MADRFEQARRALGKVRVKTPKMGSVRVDPGVAERLSKFADRASIRVLTWAARQAMLIRVTMPGAKDPAGSSNTLAEAFVLGFGEVLDWSAASLVLRDGRAHRVNLLELTGEQAWNNQVAYHQYLHGVKDGKIQIPKGWKVFDFAAFVGVGPGMLRQINSRHVDRSKPGAWIWIVAPRPLEHRIVLAEYKGGVAWVWVKPGTDKDRVGRNIGLCISDAGWRTRLQFALVDAENRPHAVLTLDPRYLGKDQPAQDANAFVSVQGDRAQLDLGRLMRDRVLLTWGECKGRFNKRPVPDPYRRYAIALATSGLIGPMTISSRTSTAGADWASLLLSGLTPKQAIPLWRKVGGHAAVVSVADQLRPTTQGDGGPNEKTLDYFSGAPVDEWLATPLAPVVLAALPEGSLQKVWSDSRYSPAVQAEALHALQRRKKADWVFWQTAVPLSKRRGVPVPIDTVIGYRKALREAEEFSRSVSSAALRRMVMGAMMAADVPLPEGANPLDVFVSLLDRGSPHLLSKRFVFNLLSGRDDQTAAAAVAVAIDRFVELAQVGGSTTQFAVERARKHAAEPHRYNPPIALGKKVTLRYLGLVAEITSSAAAEIGEEEMTPAQIEEVESRDDADLYGPPKFVTYLLATTGDGTGGWHCENCLGMGENSASIASALLPEFAWTWEVHFGSAENRLLGELLGIQQMWDSAVYDVLHPMFDGGGLAGLREAVDEWGSPTVAAALAVISMPGNSYAPEWAAIKTQLPARVARGVDKLRRAASKVERVGRSHRGATGYRRSALKARGVTDLEAWWRIQRMTLDPGADLQKVLS